MKTDKDTVQLTEAYEQIVKEGIERKTIRDRLRENAAKQDRARMSGMKDMAVKLGQERAAIEKDEGKIYLIPSNQIYSIKLPVKTYAVAKDDEHHGDLIIAYRPAENQNGYTRLPEGAFLNGARRWLQEAGYKPYNPNTKEDNQI